MLAVSESAPGLPRGQPCDPASDPASEQANELACDRPATVAALRRRVRVLERGGMAGAGHGVLSLGAPAVDAVLPDGGLALGALHEVRGAINEGAALGFVGALLARLMRQLPERAGILWCQRSHMRHETGALYAPGLAALGLDPNRLVLVRVKRDADVLWAMREGLASRCLAAVVGEVAALDLNDGRRLQLTAEASGVTGFLLGPESLAPPESSAPGVTVPSVAATRWSLAPAPSAGQDDIRWGPDTARWQAQLTRCRGGVPGAWLLEWCHETGKFKAGYREAGDRATANCETDNRETGDLSVVAALSDRSSLPSPAHVAF